MMNRLRVSRLLTIITMSVLFACLGSAAAAQNAPQTLIFADFNPGEGNSSADTSDIYRINADGSGQTRLNAEPITGYIYNLAVSPDGQQIAFLLNPSRTANTITVYTMNIDGSNLQPIVPDSSQIYTSVLWSPDGTQLLLQDNNSRRNRQTLVNADGSDLHRIQALTVGLPVDVTEWVADDRFFAVDSMGSLLWLPADGSERTPIATVGEMYWQPFAVPSPDLTQIAYMTYLDGGVGEAQTIRITDITAENELATFELPVVGGWTNPTLRWSPDGSMLAYGVEYELGYNSLFVIGADGTGGLQLTPTNETQVFAFDWLP